MESRQETGPKENKGEDRRSSKTRQKSADRKMESNDSPEIPDRGEGGSRSTRPPFGPKQQRSFKGGF